MTMTAKSPSPPARSPKARTIAQALRTAAVTVLAGLTVLSTGCQMMKSEQKPDHLGLSSSGTPDASTPKTDFHAKVGPEQEYQVHIDFGRLQETNGNLEAALAEYQKAVDVCQQRGSYLSPKKNGPAQEALAERKLAGALDRLGRFAQAEMHYQKAIKLAPADARIWNDVGYSYALQNRLDDSERALKQSDTIEPNNQKTLTNLGLTYAKQGKIDEALACLSRASGPAIAHANLGYILAAMGKTDEARAHYQESIALQPTMTAPRTALAKLDRDARQGPPALAANALVDSGMKQAVATTTLAPAVAPTPPTLPSANVAAAERDVSTPTAPTPLPASLEPASPTPRPAPLAPKGDAIDSASMSDSTAPNVLANLKGETSKGPLSSPAVSVPQVEEEDTIKPSGLPSANDRLFRPAPAAGKAAAKAAATIPIVPAPSGDIVETK